jgi:hypothetical protein
VGGKQTRSQGQENNAVVGNKCSSEIISKFRFVLKRERGEGDNKKKGLKEGESESAKERAERKSEHASTSKSAIDRGRMERTE